MFYKSARPALVFVMLLGLLSMAGVPAALAANISPPLASTSTQLPDGRYLMAGGETGQKISNRLALYDPKTQQTTLLTAKLTTPRKNHSATLLPDGRVFIFGGIGANNITLGSAELFDPASGRLTNLAAPGLVARSHHSATLLTNGKLLIVGGLANGGYSLDQAELWDARSVYVTPLAHDSILERSNAAARLLPDGNVLYQGGLDRNSHAVTSALLFDAADERFTEISLAESANLVRVADTQTSLIVTATIPPFEVRDFPPGGLIALRFSREVAVTSVNTNTVVLIGPSGAVAATVTPSQDGMLAFLTPKVDLLPATRYTLIVSGITTKNRQALAFDALGFNTASLAPGADSRDGSIPPGSDTADSVGPGGNTALPALSNADDAPDDEVFIPGPQHYGGHWRSGRVMPRELNKRYNAALAKKGDLAYEHEARKRLPAPLHAKASNTNSSVTNGSPSVTGQVFSIGDHPLSNVSIHIAGQTTQTDAQGNFRVYGLAPGHHEIFVDGTLGGNRGRQYGKFVIGLDVVAGQTTDMPTVFLPRIRSQDWIPIASPVNQDTVITHPNLPGMEIHIPKGAVLRERDGRLVTRIALVPIPLDRMAFPFPENAPVFVSVQPGGLVVQGLTPGVTKGIRVIYPNASYEPAGGAADFWRYDAKGKGWYIYGLGHASADGKQIVPDAGVAVYEAIGFMYTPPPNSSPPPLDAPPPCNSCECSGGDPSAGDPVSCSSGLFLHQRTDLALNDILPLTLSRTYRPGDNTVRPFGIGTSHPYAISLYFPSTSNYASVQLVLPDGGVIDFVRTSPGTTTSGAVFESNSQPSAYFKAQITYDTATGRWILKTKEGMTYQFSNTAGVPLVAISDRYGNALTITRSSGLIQRITTPSGRYVDFIYDVANRITKLQDNTDRAVDYSYDTAGYLQRVTYPDASFEEYTYDTAGRMLTVKDRRGNIMVTNVYDANGRVTQQTLADGGIYRFAYTLDSNDKIARSDITDPRGNITRYDFNNRLLASQTLGVGTPQAQTTAYERQTSTNLVTAIIDPLGRRTETTYDNNGNPTRITRLAGTVDAVSENFTYEPLYHQIASVTDALGKTTSYTYDTSGKLTQITDPLGHITQVSINAAGQLLSLTDPLNHTTQFSYDLGDLTAITDPLNRTQQRYLDTLGRLTVATDPLGNRTNYVYDQFDQLTRITDALGKVTQFSYDPLGNLLALTDALGNLTQHQYDAKSRLTERTDPLLKSETTQYDGKDNPTKTTDRKGQITQRTYDAFNRLSSISYADGSIIAYTWDAADRLTQIDDTLSGTVTRSYDGLDRLINETTPQGSVTYTYDAKGRRSSMTVAGQASVTYTWDDADRLTQISQGATTVTFSYDAASRRIGTVLPNGITARYEYDDANQLTRISYTRPDSSLIGDINYSYNALGQRISTTGSLVRNSLPAAATASYDPANRLTTWNGAALTYDDNGNLTNDGSNAYTWNARNRLSQISGASSASFKYDAFGRRIKKTISGTATSILYDGLNPVQELSGTTPTANLLTGLDLDEIYRRTDSQGARDFLTDALGSTLALSDSLAQIKTQYTYGPYGATTINGEANSNSFQYTGRENDGTGLYYYRARYYDPVRSRFISEDPIGFAGGVNIYTYVGGNPVNYIDPEGLKAKAIIDAIKKGVRKTKEIIDDIDVDGPNGTRVCQIRYKKQPVVRVDYGPYEGTHGEPRLHGHLPKIWPDKHIPLDPRSFSD